LQLQSNSVGPATCGHPGINPATAAAVVVGGVQVIETDAKIADIHANSDSKAELSFKYLQVRQALAVLHVVFRPLFDPQTLVPAVKHSGHSLWHPYMSS
jgi:hypothetical protein